MNAVVTFQPPRLPYHQAVEDRFGVDKTSWKALVEAVFPNAESADSVVMALSYCKARGLDIFKRPVHIVPVWDKKRGKMVETVWPGISELRTTAMRTGSYAGKDKTTFGPLITQTLGGVEISFPEWAQITVYRMVPGAGRCAFEGPEVHWLEYYATAKRDTAAPNEMWRRKPRSQLEKCAEAGALRAAFPEELGNELAAEEVEGQAFGVVTGAAAGAQGTGMRARLESRTAVGGFDADHVSRELDTALGGDQIPDHDAETGEIVDGDHEPLSSAAQGGGETNKLPADAEAEDLFPGDRPAGFAQPKAAAQDPEDWAVAFNTKLDACRSEADIDALLAEPDEIAGWTALQAAKPAMAKALDAAINGKRKALRDKARSQ